MKIDVIAGQLLEIFAVVEFRGVARAVDEPELAAFAAIFSGVRAGIREEVLRESAHGGDAGAGSDEYAVREGLAKQEESVRSVEGHSLAGLKIAEQVREESASHAVNAEVKLIGARRGGDGIGAGVRLAGDIIDDHGDELAGNEVKGAEFVDREFEMEALRRLGNAELTLQSCSKKLAGQSRDSQGLGFFDLPTRTGLREIGLLVSDVDYKRARKVFYGVLTPTARAGRA